MASAKITRKGDRQIRHSAAATGSKAYSKLIAMGIARTRIRPQLSIASGSSDDGPRKRFGQDSVASMSPLSAAVSAISAPIL
jgi:hypothetical protein